MVFCRTAAESEKMWCLLVKTLLRTEIGHVRNHTAVLPLVKRENVVGSPAIDSSSRQIKGLQV